ncbi:MAG: hydrolase 1, exosortase A system-associated, partial [Bryocella sp.]
EDIEAAIDALQQCLPAVRRVALWGLCDGASAALLYCHETRDPRVVGLCLANPWVRSAVSLARTHINHYYLQRLGQREFWVKLLSGKVASAAVQDLLRSLSLARSRKRQMSQKNSFHTRMATAWNRFDGTILLVLSGEDYTAKEFIEHVTMSNSWNGAFAHRQFVRCDIAKADHTFSDMAVHLEVCKRTIEWLDTLRSSAALSFPLPAEANQSEAT